MRQFVHNYVSLPTLGQETASDGVRFYVTPDGKRYPSVTTILSFLAKDKPSALNKWKDLVGHEEADKIARVSANRGKTFHSNIEKYIKNQLSVIDVQKMFPDQKVLFRQAEKLLKPVDNILAVEANLYSHKHKFAGQTDLIATYKNKVAIIDHKTNEQDFQTSSDEKIYKYFEQEAAYAIMFEECTGIKVHLGVLIMCSTSQNEEAIVSDLDIYKEKFINNLQEFYSKWN